MTFPRIQLTLTAMFLVVTACGPAGPAADPGSATATHTPPATASPTPEPTSTSTPVPTPLPRFFIEEFDGTVPMWSVLQSNGGPAPQDRIQDGSLIFDLP